VSVYLSITAKGQQGAGKTTALRRVIEALNLNGMVSGNGMTFFSDYCEVSQTSRESVTCRADPNGLPEPADRRFIFREINIERKYQTDKWGVEADDQLNTPWMWASYIAQYATRWMTGSFVINSDTTALFRTAMIKVAATAIAAVESIDRQRAANGKPFYEVETPPHGGDFASSQ
jgi:hypothetical protein